MLTSYPLAASGAREQAYEIAGLLLRHRRRANESQQSRRCAELPCDRCRSTQADVIEKFVADGRPVRLLLPAFPGKSPNRAKALGTLPDKAEELALGFLDSLAASILQIYPPGAEIMICSDGRVFSDAVRIPDDDITAYQRELETMIAALPQRAVSLFTLDQVPEFAQLGHHDMRKVLTERHAVPLQELRARVQQGEDVALYRAITRFLFEDGNTPEYTGSRAGLQRDARTRAYVVIQRSKAWGDFLARRFPGSVRLSIHPQPCSAAKLGIRLGESTGTWLTPWHGVAVDVGGRLVLMKRAEAERLHCELVEQGGRPSHYVLREREPAVRTADEDTSGHASGHTSGRPVADRPVAHATAVTVPNAPKEW
jgi:L-tyrosine isonitrile synthase